jgi:CrcB protein
VQSYVLVFLGGGLGAAARYWLSGVVHERFGSGFPYGTLIVNIVGCIIIGLVMGSMQERFLSHPSLRLFLTIGILGGFTTFSSFSYETIAMLRDGEVAYASLNVVASLVCCITGTWIGLVAGKSL